MYFAVLEMSVSLDDAMALGLCVALGMLLALWVWLIQHEKGKDQ